MKALFIINPSAGKQNFMEIIQEIVGKLVLRQLVTQVNVVYTAKQDDALHAAAQLTKGQYDFVVAVGGDGTLNEVINGIIKSGSETPVAAISAGTVNDFASYLELPQMPDDFCDMIKDFKCKWVDVGKFDDKYFVNVLAGGIFADVGFRVPKESKALFGKLAYYAEGAMEIPKNLLNTLKIKVESEEYNKEVEAMLFIVANSQSVGGFRTLATLASVSDGLLDVIILRKVEFPLVSNLIIRLLQGDHINHPSVDYFQTKQITISNLNEDKEVSVDYDGEYHGTLPITVEVVKHAIQMVVPKKKKRLKLVQKA